MSKHTTDEHLPLLFFVGSHGYRERHTTFFAKPFADGGWRVKHVMQTSQTPLLDLLRDDAKKEMPDALIFWEEHAGGRCTSERRDAIAWAYENGIAPLSLDFGYLNHYRQFMVDVYREDGTSSIEDEWARLSYEPIDWTQTNKYISDHVRRALRGYKAALSKPRLVPDDMPYVAFYLQQYSSLSRLQPCSTHNAIVARVAEQLRGYGVRLVVKTAPSTPDDRALSEWPDDVIVHRHEDSNNDINQRLALHAEYCLVVSSSITNEFILNGLPVVALGRSWFTGHGVFYEPHEWDDLPARAPVINNEARTRYLRWWISRQFMSDDIVPQFTERVAAFKRVIAEKHPDVDGTAITAVYAPDAYTSDVARASLVATRDALPSPRWHRIAAVDDAPPPLILDMTTSGFQVIAVRNGQPPRMGELIREAVALAQGEFVFTIEQDVFVDRAVAEAALDAMRSLPLRVAALNLQSVDETGKPNYPFTWDWPRAKAWGDDGIYRTAPHVVLSATIWRRRALQSIDLSNVPQLEFVDGYISTRLRRRGMLCLMTSSLRAVHLPHTSRAAKLGDARTLVIGCEKSVMARRGIVFDWNGSAVRPALPYNDASFREVYVGGEMELSERERVAFLKEIHRVLRVGGVFKLFDTKSQLATLLQNDFAESGLFSVHTGAHIKGIRACKSAVQS